MSAGAVGAAGGKKEGSGASPVPVGLGEEPNEGVSKLRPNVEKTVSDKGPM